MLSAPKGKTLSSSHPTFDRGSALSRRREIDRLDPKGLARGIQPACSLPGSARATWETINLQGVLCWTRDAQTVL